MTLENVAAFWDWFDDLRGDLSVRQVEERARCPRGRIGNPYSKRKQPSYLVCESIADGLRVNKEWVLRLAGLLPRTNTRQELIDEIVAIFDSMDREDQLRLINIAHGLARGAGNQRIRPA